MTFAELPVGARFVINGHTMVKRPSRTADSEDAGRWFYVRQNDLVRWVRHESV